MRNKLLNKASLNVIVGFIAAFILVFTTPLSVAQSDIGGKKEAPVKEGRVLVRTIPMGANIIVNEKTVGITPKTISLPAGRQEITLQKDGYTPLNIKVKVRTGRRIKVTYRLKVQKGRLILTNLEPRSYIYIDGRRRARTKGSEVTFKSLGVGKHQVKIKHHEMKEELFEVNIPPDDVLRMKINQIPRPGRVIVSSKPLLAEVYVDGSLVGQTPITLSMESGKRIISVKMKGFPTKKETIVVETKKYYSLHFDFTVTLEPKPDDTPKEKP